MAFYLKYRPRTIAELDNRTVATLISRYTAKDPIPHAFLFTGPRGTGKTSTARILAKSVNCQKKKNNEACGTCDVCTSIAHGENLDVLEIDAASNRGIDEIRDLREKIKLAPLSLKYKFYIIDEVHMLTTEAFNALLKTLEEPPKHAVFVLATTEAHKIPETIKSRCVHINFQKATTLDITHALTRIVEAEKIQIADEALKLLAQSSDGSFRDAVKLLEEVSLLKTPIGESEVTEMLGFVENTLLTNFLDNVRKKNIAEILRILEEIIKNGQNVHQFFIHVLQILQKELVDNIRLSQKSDWDHKDLMQLIHVFQRAFVESKSSVIQSLPFELALIEYCTNQTVPKPAQETNVLAATPTIVKTSDREADASVLELVSNWSALMDMIKSHNNSIAGVLRSCRPLHLSENKLTIEAAYKFHAERLREPKTQEVLNQVFGELLKRPVEIAVVIKNR
ncbi:DNA polymerase III subunit gamma/tau [Candidatus Microgenomates bacterium]|nr:MAG: DNA polymerase III subunit gamma/tau [Candidatus Microgenomates bacterium]